MRFTYVVSAAISFFAMSCTAGVHPLHWVIAPGFSDEQRMMIHRAPVCWNEVSSIQQQVFDDGDLPDRIYLVEALPSPYTDSSSALHVEKDGIHTIYVRRGLDLEFFLMTMQHEMGHAIGLAQMRNGGHLPPPAIMSSPTSSLVITPNDLAECRTVGVCP